MEADKDKKRLSQLIEPGHAIAKRSYVFDPKRQFSNVRKYKVTYSDELSLANLGTMLKDALAPRGKKVRRAKPPVSYKALAFGALKIIALLLILAMLGIMALAALNPPKPPGKVPQANYTLNYSYGFVNTEIISFKTAQRAYATIAFNGTGVNYTEILMRVYSEPVSRDVMLLKSRRDDEGDFESFRSSLSKMLSESGLSLGEIEINQLMHFPGNASMVLIAPTGRVPASFLGLEEPDFDLRKLLDNGVVVIYLGYKFDSGAIFESGMKKNDVSAELRKLEIAFSDFKEIARLSDGFTMTKAEYALTIPGSRSGSSVQVLHNGISVMRGKNGGYLVVFPNAISLGWDRGRGEDAAFDVYSAIRNVTWLQPTASAPPYKIGNSNRSAELEAVPTLFSAPYTKRTNLTVEFIFNVVGFDNRTSTGISYVDFPLAAKGTLNHIDWTLPTEICARNDSGSCEIYMTMDFNESASRTEQMRIVAYRDGVKYSEMQIGAKSTQLRGEKLSMAVSLPPGDFVLKIEDETGYVYAQSFLHVPKVELKPVPSRMDFNKGTFVFEVLVDGGEIPEGLGVKNVYISMDGQQNKSRSSEGGKITYSVSGAIPEGDHVFTISAAGEVQTIKQNFTRKRDWWENPIYQGMIVVAIVIFAVAMLIQKPESAVFQIDVPDFPPLSKTKVPISREQACQIFELVNSDYRWKYMPLKHGEVKNGFRKLSYKGRPILVSDYNLERVLDQMTEEGLVKKSMDFYGLASWERTSGKSLDYLSVFRSLRDSFLNMSIHFTDFGEKPDCDLMVSAHDRYYVHIYTGDETVIRAINTIPKGKTLIVFRDTDAAEAFKKSLSSTNRALILAKLYIDSESLFIATPFDMDRIVK